MLEDNLATDLSSTSEKNHDQRQSYLHAWATCVDRLKNELDFQIFLAYISPLTFLNYNSVLNEIIISSPSKLICSQVEKSYIDRIKTILEEILNSSINLNLTVNSKFRGENNQQNRLSTSIVKNRSNSQGINSEEGQTLKNNNSNNDKYILVKNKSANDYKESAYGNQNIGQPSSGDSSKFESSNSDSSNISEKVITDRGTVGIGVGITSNLNQKYTFDNFVVGNSNQFCHAASLRVAENPGKSYNPLFIYGGVGLGKTHLLHSIGNEAISKNPKTNVLYLSSEAFTNELILSLRNAKMDEFKQRLRNIEVLLIDDIQFICGKERTQEEFFHTFNALYSAKRQIVLTSDKIPSEIPGIEERLQTRFSWGLTADLQAPDFETRVAILKRKAGIENFFLPEDVSHFIAEKVSSNIRELEGALTRLHAVSSLQGIPINLKTASFALQPLIQPKLVNITIDDIKKAVASHFNLKLSDIVSKSRTKTLSFPRHIAMYLCRKHTTASYPEIGGQFGGRDHSSVIHAASVVGTKMGNDSKIKEVIEDIEKRIFG